MINKLFRSLQRLFKIKLNLIFILLIIIVTILASRDLFKSGYFIMHDDLQMMRQLEMEKCFKDKQIPCRWVPDMGYGFGFPLFNYYPPLPYLIGEVVRLAGFAFTTTVRLTFVLSFLFSGLAMYFLAKEFFGRLGGLLSSVFYIWAPYHAVDIYVRGAMNESWAFVFFPFAFLTSYKLITEKKDNLKWSIGLALSWFGLLTSHNLMVIIFAPVFIFWCVFFVLRVRNFKKIILLSVSGVFAVCLSAFFTIPFIFERGYIQTNSLISGYYDYMGHFASVKQLFFSIFWGYGPSVFGDNDQMAFPVGQIHWIISLMTAFLVVLRVIKRKKIDIVSYIALIGAAIGLFGAFMAHSKSDFVWSAFPILKYIQFPWRFLTISAFGFSLSVGSIIYIISDFREKKRWFENLFFTNLLILVTLVLSVSVISFNWRFFKEYGLGPVTDDGKFSGDAWVRQQGAAISDYLPVTAKSAPVSPRGDLAEAMSGDTTFNVIGEGTNWARFETTVKSDTSEVRINLLDFPNWKVFVDNKEEKKYIPANEDWGRIWINIDRGQHEVYLKLYNTPIRSLSNYISVVSWLLLIIIVVKPKLASKVKDYMSF